MRLRRRTIVRFVIISACLAVMLSTRAGAYEHLVLSPTSISFAAADPDTTPVIPASSAVSVTYGTDRKNGWTLTMIANNDFQSGSATIPISNLTWTATPTPPLQNGVMSKTTAQTLASGSTEVKPDAIGTVYFSLNNSWTYSVGAYSATITFTLTAP